MFCGKCGTKINDGDSFCTNCGAKVRKNERVLYDGEGNAFVFEVDDDSLENNEFKLDNKHDKTGDIRSAKCVIEYDNKTNPDEMDFIVTNNKNGRIEWLVLEKDEDKILLISKKILYYTSFETKRYLEDSWLGDGKHETISQIDWGLSDARKYLNNDIYDAFDDSFKNEILKEVPNKTYDVEEDKLFILSAFEYSKYFGEIDNVENKRIVSKDSKTNEIKDIWCLEAEYAYDDHMDIITESYNRKYISIDENGISHIRSTSSGSTLRGIRPAMWVKI